MEFRGWMREKILNLVLPLGHFGQCHANINNMVLLKYAFRTNINNYFKKYFMKERKFYLFF